MERYQQLVYKALYCVRTDKSTWFLGFIQIACLFLALSKLDDFFMSLPVMLWACGLLAIFSFSSVFLWLKIQNLDAKTNLLLPLKLFLILSLRVWLFAVLGVILAATLKAVHMHWIFFSFLASLLVCSLVVCMLAAALYRQTWIRSLWLAADFWREKMSIMSAGVFVIIFAHGCSFYFAHAFDFDLNVRPTGRFSGLHPFATIWLLVIALGAIAAVCAGFLNAYLVLLFLDLARPKKFQEMMENPAIHPAVSL